MVAPGEPLRGRRALVTGGSAGIGRAIGLALSAAGADVAVCARTPETLRRVVGEIEEQGRRGLAVPCDVIDPDQVRRMVAAVAEGLGGIDVLVNNAGRGESHRFLDHPDELWQRMLALNLSSVYYVTKAVAPLMVKQRWGRIVNIASTSAKIGARYAAAYTAAKHGVLGLTRALAAELVADNVTVNAICPGYAKTPMTEDSIRNIVARTGMDPAEARRKLEAMSPQARLIEPEEVAAVVVFLAQEAAQGITGQAINVDGGSVTW